MRTSRISAHAQWDAPNLFGGLSALEPLILKNPSECKIYYFSKVRTLPELLRRHALGMYFAHASDRSATSSFGTYSGPIKIDTSAASPLGAHSDRIRRFRNEVVMPKIWRPPVLLEGLLKMSIKGSKCAHVESVFTIRQWEESAFWLPTRTKRSNRVATSRPRRRCVWGRPE